MLERAGVLGVAASLVIGGAGCGSPGAPGDPGAGAPLESASTSSDGESDPSGPTGAGPAMDCPERVPVWREGEEREALCPQEASRQGLTVLDLGDAWVPRLFRAAPELGPRGRSSYRDRYLVHAEERHPPGTPPWRRRRPPPRYLEVYGIFPTFRVLRGRLLDEERHTCHAAIDRRPLERLHGTLRPWSGGGVGRQARRARFVRRAETELETVRAARGLVSIAQLADDPRYGERVARLEAAQKPVHAVRALQGILRCDGLTGRGEMRDGAFDHRTLWNLRTWQQKHFVIGRGVLDEDTREALARPSRENDFRSVLRALRERVVDAAGLLADGSAAGGPGTVLGRQLDPPELRVTGERPPLPAGAPDRVSPATEAAARALGWTDPEATARWLIERFPEEGRPRFPVAVPLGARAQAPFPPATGGGGPALLPVRAEIDRGDVWYRAPFWEDGRPRARPVRVSRRPTLTVYAGGASPEGDQAQPLVRWSTTIGGWHREIGPEGEVGLAYKESPVGRRVWRNVLAAPTWMPPPATPDDELFRVGGTLVGPGYESAYGLVMLEHSRVEGGSLDDVLSGRLREGDQPPPEEGGDGRGVRFGDEGIRTHGSVSYRSILSGESHGCHRLFNHLAVRLGGWLLAHRPHRRHGPQAARYRRFLADPEAPDDPERVVELQIDVRGDRFELTPPVEVAVLEGRIRGRPRRPIEGVLALPEDEEPAEDTDQNEGDAATEDADEAEASAPAAGIQDADAPEADPGAPGEARPRPATSAGDGRVA
ncbi:MAG TPA: hypothetical protein RMF84_07735, partial [Polyangiaceae bacterium LLY-WYZ-14_1]|nr:hypothetical protein [Polyangiaceae bacterium LLY-WYZ-14_1]